MSTDPYGRPGERSLPPTRAFGPAGQQVQPVDPYGAPLPRRRSRVGWWLIGVPLVLVLCCGAGVLGYMISGDGGSSSAGTPPGGADVEEPAVPDVAGVGDPVRDGKFEFVVTEAETGVAQVGEGIITRTAQGRYVLVHLTIKNIGDEAQLFDGSSQRLIDTDRREHSADLAAALFLADSGSFFNVINPGNSVAGIVAFDVPVEATPATVRLHDSLFSGGVEVSLASG